MSDPREAEALNEPGSFEYRGETFTVTRNRDEWTLDFLESVEEGKPVGIIRGALGPDQWRTVKGMNLTVKDADELSDLIASAMGFGDVGGIYGLVRLIRDHGDAVEADLAFRGIDLRDFYRPGSGLTPRRLLVLIRGLPPEAWTWQVVETARQESVKPIDEQLRDRAAYYRGESVD